MSQRQTGSIFFSHFILILDLRSCHNKIQGCLSPSKQWSLIVQGFIDASEKSNKSHRHKKQKSHRQVRQKGGSFSPPSSETSHPSLLGLGTICTPRLNPSVHLDRTRMHQHYTQHLPHAGNGMVAQSEAEFAGPSEICDHLFPYSVHVFEELKVFSGHSLQTGNGSPW